MTLYTLHNSLNQNIIRFYFLALYVSVNVIQEHNLKQC